MTNTNESAQALLRIVPTELAGGGSTTQAVQIDQCLEELARASGCLFRTIGVSTDMSFIDTAVVSSIRGNDRLIESSNTVSGRYKNAYLAIRDELRFLADQDIRVITAVCCGYTSYALFGLKLALDEINATRSNPVIINAIIEDSSFPDTDQLSNDLDSDGFPTTRFYGPAYESSQYINTLFLLNGSAPFDTKRSRRKPAKCEAQTVAVPYTAAYIQAWQSYASRSPEIIRRDLLDVFPALTQIRADYDVVPLLASGGCWDASSVGKWMTQEQYQSVLDGTRTLIEGLVAASQKTERIIVVPIVQSAALYIQSLDLPFVSTLDQYSPDTLARVILVPYESIPQGQFRAVIAGAIFVINRSVQANSFAESVLIRKPGVIITLPAKGYMESELMSENLERGILPYTVGRKTLVEEFSRLLTDRAYAATLADYLYSILMQLYTDPSSNFANVVGETMRASVN